jgi:hypothetical protein
MDSIPDWLIEFLHEGEEPDVRSADASVSSGKTEGATPSSCASAPPNWGVRDMAGGSEVLMGSGGIPGGKMFAKSRCSGSIAM